MVPIDGSWMVSSLTSFQSNIASLTIFETFDIIYIIHRSNDND